MCVCGGGGWVGGFVGKGIEYVWYVTAIQIWFHLIQMKSYYSYTHFHLLYTSTVTVAEPMFPPGVVATHAYIPLSTSCTEKSMY